MISTDGTLHESDGRISAEGSLEMGLAGDGWLRYGIADLGDVVEEARGRLDLSPIAAAALGRSMAAATLLLRLSLSRRDIERTEEDAS